MFGRKCYCCGEVYPKENLFYCEECLIKIRKAFETEQGVVVHPKETDHCISCGEYDGRRIVYTGNSGFFPKHPKDTLPICNKCAEKERKEYAKYE